jgi:hypothetical protein
MEAAVRIARRTSPRSGQACGAQRLRIDCAVGLRTIVFLLLRIFGLGRMREKRFLGLLASGLGLVAGILMLAAAAEARLDLARLAVAFGVLYGSYLIFRGKSSLVSGWAKIRMGAWINLVLGLATLLIPGGQGGMSSLLAVASGILGLLSA